MLSVADYLSTTANDRSLSEVVALASKKRGKWETYSFKEYDSISSGLALGLTAMGITKGDMVVTISGNCPEWNFIDVALMKIGAVHVALFPNFNLQEITKILNECEAKIVFSGIGILQKQIEDNSAATPFLKRVFNLNIAGIDPNDLGALISQNISKDDLLQLKKITASVNGQDLAAVLYTSGTNGKPNGVLVNHKQIAVTLDYFDKNVFSLLLGDSVLSFLPLCHAFERFHSYIYLKLGLSVFYAETVASILDNIREVKPHHFNGVPALLETIFKIFLATKAQLLTQEAQDEFEEAVKHTQTYFNSTKQAYFNNPKTAYYDKKFYAPFRVFLGGNLKSIGSAGAKLNVELVNFFMAIGIPLIEWYGITEVLIVTYNNYLIDGKPGTLGKAAITTLVKVAYDGEILCKGDTVTKGYLKNPELTKLVFDEDGWYHTNDLGEIDEDGYLKLWGRKNSIVKLPNGRFINPEDIEKAFLSAKLINQILVYQNDRSELCAMLNLKENVDEVLDVQIAQEIETIYNQKVLSEFEKIKHWEKIADVWSIQSGHLTPMMKMRRKAIRETNLL